MSQLATRQKLVLHAIPRLRLHDSVDQATRTLMTSSLPGLPVVDDNESFVGTFGERECLAANFPAYAGLLQNGDIVPPALNEILAADPSDVAAPVAGYVNLANVAIGPEFSDLQIAVKFLHHQVAILPIVKEGKLEGVIRRDDFLEAVTGTAHN